MINIQFMFAEALAFLSNASQLLFSWSEHTSLCFCNSLYIKVVGALGYTAKISLTPFNKTVLTHCFSEPRSGSLELAASQFALHLQKAQSGAVTP